MEQFTYVNATSVEQVPSLLDGGKWGETMIIAGGTDLLGELQEHVETPKKLVNLKTIPGLDEIKEDGSALMIGALVTLSEIAAHPMIRMHYTALAEAAHAVGSPQIRNVGTIGGNLCQRPRCWYYRDATVNCLKKGGDICLAADGLNKYHSIFGGGPVYIVHPSDTAPALIALGAHVKIVGPNGEKIVDLEEFFVLPEDNPYRENILEPNEVVTEIHVPKPASNMKSCYVKVREKGSIDFALASVAAACEIDGMTCREANIVLGGVAPVPWRSKAAESVLNGKRITERVAKQAGEAAVKNAQPLNDNEYKVTLTRNIISRAATMIADG
jgi:xanthine dehydrogenase YagS FAD-binding subunit